LQNFRKLKVWEKGHALTLAVYRATVKFPSSLLKNALGLHLGIVFSHLLF